MVLLRQDSIQCTTCATARQKFFPSNRINPGFMKNLIKDNCGEVWFDLVWLYGISTIVDC